MEKANSYRTIIKKGLIVCAALLLSTNVSSQISDPTVGLLSPNAASLGSYGDIPVSQYTGTVNVSIPIHTLSSKGVDLPILLSYDASGVKVSNIPGWVGQNWSLSAGGVISRIVQGNYPDEYEYVSENAINFSNYFESYPLLPQLINNETNLRSAITSLSKRDLDPDIFTFNFMGKSGHFFLGSDGQWKVSSEWNIDVIFDVTTDAGYQSNLDYPFIQYVANSTTKKQSKTIAGFKLRDDQGNIYTFGYSPNAIEYYLGFFNQTIVDNGGVYPCWTANSWYLTEVTDKYSNIIYRLNYERDYFVAHLYNQYSRTNFKASGGGATYGSNNSSQYPYISGDLISPVYLTKIEDYQNSTNVSFSRKDCINEMYPRSAIGAFIPFYLSGRFNTGEAASQSYMALIEPYIYKPNGSIDYSNFLRGLRSKKLNHIGIYVGSGIYKVFEFIYNNGNEGINSRLYLSSLKIHDERFYYGAYDQGLLGSYKFTYNNIESLPNYLSTAEDHWGYYNGKPYSIPVPVAEHSGFYAKREPDVTKMLYGTLTSMQYPTGGKTTFTYGSHEAGYKVSSNRQSMEPWFGQIGGARIMEIIDRDTDGSLIKKRTYEYIDIDGNSSGELSATPVYYWNWTTNGATSGTSVSTTTFRTSSIVPLTNTFGPYIGYSRVVEKVSSGEYGKTVWRFSNFSNFKDSPSVKSFDSRAPSPYDRFSENTHKRGKLLTTQYYNISAQLTKEISYQYRSDNPEFRKYILSSNLEFNYGIGSATLGYFTGDVYKKYYSVYDVVKENITEKRNERNIIYSKEYDKQDFSYITNGVNNIDRQVNVRLLVSEIQSGSDTDRPLKTEYTYPLQTQEENALMETLSNNFITGTPYKIVKYRGDTPIQSSLTQYKTMSLITVPVPMALQTSTDNTNFVEEIGSTDYDQQGNLRSYKTKKNEYVFFVWGGSKRQLLLAKIEGLKNSGDLPTLNTSLINSKLIEEFNRIRVLRPDLHITSYTYKYPSALETITDSRGVTTYHQYDKFGRIIKKYILEDGIEKIIESYEYNYQNK